jgi:hypothetical protein
MDRRSASSNGLDPTKSSNSFGLIFETGFAAGDEVGYEDVDDDEDEDDAGGT